MLIDGNIHTNNLKHLFFTIKQLSRAATHSGNAGNAADILSLPWRTRKGIFWNYITHHFRTLCPGRLLKSFFLSLLSENNLPLFSNFCGLL